MIEFFKKIYHFLVSLGIPPKLLLFFLASGVTFILAVIIKTFSVNEEQERMKKVYQETHKTYPGFKKTNVVTTTTVSSMEYRVANRHFPRIPIKLKTKYILEGIDPISKECIVVDISQSGLAFVCTEKIDTGVKVRLNLPNVDENYAEKEFSVAGEVMRCKPNEKSKDFEHGIRFFHLLREKDRLLSLLIQKYN